MDIASFISNNSNLIVHIVGILIGAWLVVRFGSIFVKKAVVKTIRNHRYRTRSEEEKRENTIIHIINSALHILVWPIAVILIIAQVGINIGPLIAGAGIIGVALGFGAQSLVKDVISGLFIIVENQYGVGDVVDLDGTSGVVEDINLRKTTLRDLDGAVHHVPNGTIDRASNLSSEYAGVNLNVGIGYSSNLDKVIGVVDEVGIQLAKDPKWMEDILEAPAFLRVDNFGDSSIEIKITGRTKPLQQWAVTGELRKRLKVAFDKNDIEIPFPQRVVHQSKA